MKETLNDFHTSISIGGRLLCNLRFADDTDLMVGSEVEVQYFATRLETRMGPLEGKSDQRKARFQSTAPVNIH